VTLSDLSITHVAPSARDGSAGRGLEAWASTVHLSRVAIEDVRDPGIFVGGLPSSFEAQDLSVRDVRGRALDTNFGDGVYALAHVSLARTLIERTRLAGIVAAGPDADLLATDVIVRDIADAVCATSTCMGMGAAVGIGAYARAHAGVSHFVVLRSASIGVQLAGRASIDLADGLISSVPIGVNVQVPSYALDRLTQLVRFDSVSLPLDAQFVPVPAVASM
jgi:hypothetical protein